MQFMTRQRRASTSQRQQQPRALNVLTGFVTYPFDGAGSCRWLAILCLAALGLAATILLPPTASANTPPPGPCEDGYVAPTPTNVPVTSVPIKVSSTTADYFVLYVEVGNVFTVSKVISPTSSLAVSVTLGEDGTTTLADNLAPLSADRYRVEKYSVAQPGDIDGDCIDDITELAGLGTYNPINPAKSIDIDNGAIVIDSLETFQDLSFDGETGYASLADLRNMEFLKFTIMATETDNPITYFLNTNKTKSHGQFLENIGVSHPPGALLARGNIVYHPNLPAPDGTLGIYHFDFDGFELGDIRNIAKFNEILASAMPLLDNELFYHPSTNEQIIRYHREKDEYDASRVNVLLREEILADVKYIPFNQAEGYGRLRLMTEDDRPSIIDVAIYEALPNDLPRVAGTITTVPQTPLSHVNLRAIQNGLPNAFIRDALTDDAITSLIGSYVYYAVGADGYTIRSATKAEVDTHFDSLRPKSAQTLQRDLSVTTITSLANVSFADWNAFGVKAANVAELTKLGLPDGTTPVGFAVPFYFYDEFMKQATLGEETILGKKKAPDEEKITLSADTKLAEAVSAMLGHSHFQTDFDIQEEMLDDLRKAIKKAEAPDWIITALVNMHAEYPEGQSLRYRSSTNNEDLPSFNGAGLYSSKTQDPEETAEDGIDKSIKAVWASLWNYRAFLERDFHRVTHSTVAMGVLVHPNYSDELVNGVAVSYDPITFQDNAYYVNSQVGEDLVTNPEAHSQPEQLLLGSAGAATVLSRSNLAPSNELLMSDAQMRQLRSNLDTIHNRFKTLYGVKDGEDFAVEIEFKITAENQLAIKQARPWIFPEPLELANPEVVIAFKSAQVAEGESLELTATRSGGILSTPLTVDLTWSETRAMLKQNKPASVTIPGNRTSVTIAAPIHDDQEDEHDSVVTVSIGANSGYTIGTPGSASATVTDDDQPKVQVRADAGTVTEGSPVGFTFTRSGSVLEQPLTVSVTVTDAGSRLAGALPATVAFAANSATVSVSLPITDDSVWTGPSDVTVQISAGSDYGIHGSGKAKVTVKDDELRPPDLFLDLNHAVASGNAYVLRVYPAHYQGTLSIDIGGPDAEDFTDYIFANILLMESQHYDRPADANRDGVYEIDITASDSHGGTTKARLRFTVTNAKLISLAEQQWDQLSHDQRERLLPEVANSRLKPDFAGLDNDLQAIVLRLARQEQLTSSGPMVSIAAGSDITEGESATFTVSASPAPASNLDASVTVSQGGDYGATTGSRTVTIPTTGSVTFTVSTTDDSADEADGSVTATVNAGSAYTVSSTQGAATVSVSDNDDASKPVVSVTGGNGVTEGGSATFTVSASPAPAANLDVSVTVSQSGDYGATTGKRTVTIPTTGSVTLNVGTTDDSTDETDGSVTATLDTPTADAGYTVSSTQGAATVSVSDNDATKPVVSVTGGSGVTEGGNASFTVSASPAPAANLDVSVTVSQSGDYGATTGKRTVTIPTTGSVTLNVGTTDDSTDETDGSVTATLDTPTADAGYTVSSTQDTATVSVADNDDAPKPVVSVTGGSGVTEGGSAAFTVSASPAPAANLDVSVTVSQSGDYGATTGKRTVTIPTTGSVTFTVATTDDSADETDGSVTATLDTPAADAGYTVDATQGAATVAVSDDDDTVGYTMDATVLTNVKSYAAETHEGAEHVNRWNRVLVAFGEHDGIGVTGGPMTAAEAQTYADKGWQRWVPVVTELTSLEAANNNDPKPEISVSAGAGITEGGSASFTVSASPAPAANLAVSVTVSQSGDYGATTGKRTVTIPTTGSVTFTVATTDDSTDETDGSVTATLDTPTADAGYTVSSTQGAATVSVSDNDDAPPPPPTPEISVSGGSGITEGGSASFTLTASPAPLANLDVSVTVSQSGDYGATTGSRTVTIPTTGSVTLNIGTTDDSTDETDGSVTATVDAGSAYTVSSTQGAATVTVSDNDDAPKPVVSVSGGNGVTEGGSATFTVSASLAPASNLDVSVTVSASGDYGATTGKRTVTIPTTGSVTFTVGTTDDSTDETDGSVTATLDTPAADAGYTVSSTQGAATVSVSDNDDAPKPVVSVTGGNGVTEGGERDLHGQRQPGAGGEPRRERHGIAERRLCSDHGVSAR